MDPSQLFEVALLVDESPQLLTDVSFTEPIQDDLRRLNGSFTTAASRHGVDREDAEQWLLDTQKLLNRWIEPGLGEAADLAVRLSALAYILSEQGPDQDISGTDLLAKATVAD